MQSAGPVGTYGFGGDEWAVETSNPRAKPKPAGSSFSSTFFLGVFLLAVVAGVAVAMYFGLSNNSASLSPSQSQGLVLPSPPPTEKPTKYPTKATTLQPSVYPTLYPTTSSPTLPTTPRPTTRRPTVNPTVFPTGTPSGDCADPDAQCGCNQVTSKLVDVIFIIDESGSVGSANFVKMKNAVIGFVQSIDPPLNLTSGSRFGYYEFSDTVNDEIELTTFSTATAFTTAVQNTLYKQGGTDHRIAFETVKADLEKPVNALRAGSQLLIIMMTDGNPCVDCRRARDSANCQLNGNCPSANGACCLNSLALANGASVLRAMRDEFPFTFVFIPITPDGVNNGQINEDLFDAAIGQQGSSPGLSEAEFIRTGTLAFDELSTFLNNTDIIPLGPCVDAPTVSSGDRLLFALETVQNNNNDDDQDEIRDTQNLLLNPHF